jgi:hypothetical protein
MRSGFCSAFRIFIVFEQLLRACRMPKSTAQGEIATKRYRSLPLLKRPAATTPSAVLNTALSLCP